MRYFKKGIKEKIGNERLKKRLSKYFFFLIVLLLIFNIRGKVSSPVIFSLLLTTVWGIDSLLGSKKLKEERKNLDNHKKIALMENSVTTEIKKDKLSHWIMKKEAEKNFKILQLTDIHIGNGPLSLEGDRNALKAVQKLMYHVKPDLVIVTGDMVYPVLFTTGSADNLTGSKRLAQLMESFKTPWTVTFGNHDEEFYSWYPLEKVAEVYENSSHCLFQRGPSNISGLSNHIINILNPDDSLNTSLVMLHTNSYINPILITHYDHVHKDQVRWYEEELNAVSKLYGVSEIANSLAFFHIPVNEFIAAWDLFENDKNDPEIIYHFGNKTEKISAPLFQSPLFPKMLELGSTKGVFVGHDHFNDFSITYKGIRLTYGKSIDYIAYPNKSSRLNWQRGGTIIEIDEKGDFSVNQILLDDIS